MNPQPGQSVLTNLVATLIKNGNTPANLNLGRIAHHQPVGITEGDLLAEFERQAPTKIIPPTSDQYGEGK